MTETKTIGEINRELGEWVLDEAKRNRQAYAGRFVGIANGKVVIATDDLNELARKLDEADPDNAATTTASHLRFGGFIDGPRPLAAAQWPPHN